jgi:hypothetical protein
MPLSVIEISLENFLLTLRTKLAKDRCPRFGKCTCKTFDRLESPFGIDDQRRSTGRKSIDVLQAVLLSNALAVMLCCSEYLDWAGQVE